MKLIIMISVLILSGCNTYDNIVQSTSFEICEQRCYSLTNDKFNDLQIDCERVRDVECDDLEFPEDKYECRLDTYSICENEMEAEQRLHCFDECKGA